MSRPSRLAWLAWGWLGACTLAACTLDAGSGFVALEPGELSASVDPVVVTDLGYEVTLERASLEVAHVELQERHAEGEAEPSEHAHEHDETEPLGTTEGEEAYEPLVAIEVDSAVDLLAGGLAPLSRFEPSSELPGGAIDRAEVVLTAIELAATLTHPDREDAIELVVDLALDLSLHAALHQAIDRDAPAKLAPHVRILVREAFLDGLDFGALARDGRVVLDDPEADAAATLIESIAGSDATVTLEKEPGE